MANETEKPPIDTVRAKIAEMRKWAEYVRRYWVNVSGVSKTLDDGANALEAVLDAAPCEQVREDGLPCGFAWVRHGVGFDHSFKAAWLEAALTRAITKGKQ